MVVSWCRKYYFEVIGSADAKRHLAIIKKLFCSQCYARNHASHGPLFCPRRCANKLLPHLNPTKQRPLRAGDTPANSLATQGYYALPDVAWPAARYARGPSLRACCREGRAAKAGPRRPGREGHNARQITHATLRAIQNQI